MSEVLVTCQDLNLRYSTQVLLDDAALTVHIGDKLGVVGRNGCGKSSFLRILAKVDEPDSGAVSRKSGLIAGYLPQEFALRDEATVLENVRDGASHITSLIDEFEAGEASSGRLAELQNGIEAFEGWSLEPRIETAMKSLNTPPADRIVRELSGGEKRRVALCRAIVGEPELLILDEPTNHLDAESIEWLEEFLKSYAGACIFVTHDRYFLDRVATRIAELDTGKFFSHEGGYSDYLAAKAERKALEANTEARRQKFLKRELEWVRSGVQARRTKEQHRLDSFYEIEGQDEPEAEVDVQMILPPAPGLGNVVVDLEGVGMIRDERRLFMALDLEFPRGTCTGIVGRNGLGKTTLLNILMGELKPTEGRVAIGKRTIFNYADQSRMAIDGSKSMIDEVGAGSEFVQFGNQKLHIRSYLSRYGFQDEQVHARIDTLSGGEQNRVMLAKLLHRGGNFLILDEPTNDLDLNTLRVLEEAVLSFTGVTIVVSHDRYFLDRVADRILAFEGDGEIVLQDGNYSYYAEKRNQRRRWKSSNPAKSKAATKSSGSIQEKARKLTWKEERELEGMEDVILEKESRVEEIDGLFSDPEFYTQHGEQAEALNKEREALQKETEALYVRWEELEQIRTAAEAG